MRATKPDLTMLPYIKSSVRSQEIMDHLSTDDQQWQTKALQLAEKKSSFDVHDLKAGADTTFVIELANKYAYPRPVRRAGAGFYVLGRRSSDGSGIHDPGSRRRD